MLKTRLDKLARMERQRSGQRRFLVVKDYDVEPLPDQAPPGAIIIHVKRNERLPFPDE